ncbi:MAG: shikimate kinase [Nitrospirae bacterium]|nr:shikimate kinase [Nitrospirota bacterium]
MESETDRGKANIVLVGMPGSGKSTVGVILAKMTSRGFVDTDVIIQTSQGRSLQDIVNTEGYMALRQIEEDTLMNLKCINHVIATGGSAVYSHSAMQHLKSRGVIVFLDVALPVLEARISNFDKRGLARRPDQSLRDLFRERLTLYRKYADITIGCGDLNQDEICAQIISLLFPLYPAPH